MRYTIHKLFFTWSFEKEEKWLNSMAAKGLCLVSVGFCKFEFEECEPGEYGIKMLLLDKSVKHIESKKLIKFFEETGAEHIGTCVRWAYFRKKRNDGEFEIYSDNESKLKSLTKLIAMIFPIVLCNFFIGIENIIIAILTKNSINYTGVINIVLSVLGTIGIVRLFLKRNRLKKEMQLFE